MQAFGRAIKLLVETPESHMGVPGFSPDSALDSGSLLTAQLERQKQVAHGEEQAEASASGLVAFRE